MIDVPCQGGGFLGSAFAPFQITGDPATAAFDARMLQRPAAALARPDRESASAAGADRRDERLVAIARCGTFVVLRAGLRLTYVRVSTTCAANRLGRRPYAGSDTDCTKTKPNRGGQAAALAHGRNLRGQSLLQARRLVESGIPFVNVNDFRQQGQNWDSHADNFGQHKNYLLPPIDKALSALIEDLEERGLLETTLVLALGEFGRTPTINGNAGRDHWPDCYTILLAGGGVSGGTVYGSSDSQGRYPERDPVTPADLAATIYWRFGVDPQTEMHDATGRPWRLSDGMPLVELFS